MHLIIISFLTIFGGLFAFLGYALFNFSPVEQAAFATEGGFIETVAASAFFIVAFLGFVKFLQHKSKMNFIFFALMALAGAREMDWHKEWTTQSVLKSRFYIDPTTPAIEKLIGFILILFLIYAAWQLLKRVPQFVANLWHFIPTAWAIGFGLGLITVAKILDSMARILPFAKDFHTDNKEFLMLIEESFELTGALFFLVFVILRLKNRV